MDTKAGKLGKLGPIATLAGASFNPDEKLLYTGSQFVKFVPKTPLAIQASAHELHYVTEQGVVDKHSYRSFKDSSGTFKLINGNPAYEEGVTGIPESDYHYVIIGYNNPVTTNTVKFWAEDYIPYDLIRIDYSHDGSYFFEIPTSAGDVSFEFDDTQKVYDTETSPSGQFIYTVDLGKQYTAKYWRIRSFIYTYNTTAVADVNGKNVALVTTSGLPSTSSLYTNGDFYYNSHSIAHGMIEHSTSYSGVSESAGGYTLSNLEFVPGGSNLGTVYAGASISLEEYLYTTKTMLVCDEDTCGSFICRYGSSADYPECFSERVFTFLDGINTLYTAVTTSGVTLLSSPQKLDVEVDAFMPTYSTGVHGPSGGSLSTVLRYMVDELPSTSVTYSSIAGNSLVATNFNYWDATDDLDAGHFFVYTYPMKLTQVRVFEKEGPAFVFWESDGDVSVSNTIECQNLYDAVYDTADGLFYVIGYKENMGVGTPAIDDSFASGVGNSFDVNKWDIDGNAFYRDSIAESLVFINSTDSVSVYGSLISKAYLKDTFTVSADITKTTATKGGTFGFSLRDKETQNEFAYVYSYDDWSAPSTRSILGANIMSLLNYSDGVVTVRNLGFVGDDVPVGTFRHTFSYDSGWYYTRENISSPGVNEVATTWIGVGPFLNTHGISLLLDAKGLTVYSGAYVSFITVASSASSVSSLTPTLSISYNSVTEVSSISYDDGSNHTLVSGDVFYQNVGAKINLRGNTAYVVEDSMSALYTTGNVFVDAPCLYVDVVDSTGELGSVTGVSTTDGVVIDKLDVVANPENTYDSLFGQINIATTQSSVTAGGSLFIRVGETLYKYNKVTLPLTSVEDGSNAVATVSGVFPSNYINGFMYDGYTIGGLSYLWRDDFTDETTLNLISDSTLVHSTDKAWLDLSSVYIPCTRDANDLSSMYIVNDDSVYVLNTDEDSVAFCNVISTDPILPASSDYSTTVTARVTNMFGKPLSHKSVSFVITDGGGTLSSASACTTSSGTASITFTASTVVGTTKVVATASDDSC